MAKRKKTTKKAATKTTATKKQVPKKSAAAKPRASAGKGPKASRAVTHDQIAKRAYEIWMENGRPTGTEHEHWCQAQAQLAKK